MRLRPDYPEGHFNLARAFAVSGRTTEAKREAATAEALAASVGKTELVAALRNQLRR